MDELITKKHLRTKVEYLCGRTIYGTTNCKATGQYRMSIPWHWGVADGRFADIDPVVWRICDLERDAFIGQLEKTFPQLKGQISVRYHIGSGIYLSLRVNNAVLA